MNSLSWLLYGADVTQGLRVAAIICLVGIGIAAFALPPKGVTPFSGDHAPFSGLARPSVWVCFALCMTVLVFTPSRNTIMLIAASEVGATVLASTEAQQIGGEASALATDSLRVLRKFINEQLNEEK